MKPTTVINIKSGQPYDVYIGRAGKGQSGYFGNPIQFGKPCPVCGIVHPDTFNGRQAVLYCYKRWFWNQINTDDEFYERCFDLAGKILGCFCKPKACHGDVIVAWINAGAPRDPEYDPEAHGFHLARQGYDPDPAMDE